MAEGGCGHECYHCKQWVKQGDGHDCWTTTEAALTRHLSDDLRDAWERIRETAVDFGEQRIYASHHSIMFARKACYFFVRPKQKYLELCVFLRRLETSPRIRRVHDSSTTKRAHMLRVVHRDEVEAPLTDWLREAYDFADPQAPRPRLERCASKKASRSKTGATNTVARAEKLARKVATKASGNARTKASGTPRRRSASREKRR